MGPEPRSDEALPAPAAPMLETRELSILGELARDADAQVAFQGLRRRLGIHQESLSRTLRRLEAVGLVAKDHAGYRLTEGGRAAVQGREPERRRRDTVPILNASLPPHVDAQTVAAHLQRRWFRGLRWYGASSQPGGVTMTWLSDTDDATVRIRVQDGSFRLDVEVPPGESRRAFSAARGVLNALSELYGLGARHDEPSALALVASRSFAA